MRTHEIFVTNHNDFHHEDNFDGTHYDFPPKERVAVGVDAATHMFGFNMPDKSGVLTRLGWAWKYDPEKRKVVEDPDGVKRLSRFVFTRAVMVEAPAEETGQTAALSTGLLPLPEPARARPKGAIDFLAADVQEPLV